MAEEVTPVVISSHAGDYGYDAYRHLVKDGFKFWEVYLDGQLMEHVIRANVQAGVVERYKTDEDGRIALAPSRDELVTEELRGEVRIVGRKTYG